MKSSTGSAIALHPSAESRRTRAERGFKHWWGTALDQLVEQAKTM